MRERTYKLLFEDKNVSHHTPESAGKTDQMEDSRAREIDGKLSEEVDAASCEGISCIPSQISILRITLLLELSE